MQIYERRNFFLGANTRSSFALPGFLLALFMRGSLSIKASFTQAQNFGTLMPRLFWVAIVQLLRMCYSLQWSVTDRSLTKELFSRYTCKNKVLIIWLWHQHSSLLLSIASMSYWIIVLAVIDTLGTFSLVSPCNFSLQIVPFILKIKHDPLTSVLHPPKPVSQFSKRIYPDVFTRL